MMEWFTVRITGRNTRILKRTADYLKCSFMY